MTEIEKAIAYFERAHETMARHGHAAPLEEINALAALYEKQKRQNGCEYCTDLSRYKGFGYAEFFHQTAPDEAYETGIEVKFCPNCGRILEGENHG